MKIIETNLIFKNKFKKMNKPSMIVIHHAAHSSAAVDDIHRWHIENGWSECGYHFFITKDGKVYRGRPENTVGSHCRGYNMSSLGICLQGNYDVEEISYVQILALIKLCHYLCEKYDIDTIKGHGELKSTNCPGTNFPLSKVKEKNLQLKNYFDTYTVKAGDTLWSIAESFNISVDNLIRLNGLNGSLIYPNQILRII